MDQAIAALIQDLNITLPILHIKDNLYLVGPVRMSCEMKRDFVMLRVGGGYEKFVEHVPKNHRFYERTLVVHMIKSGESLEWVIDALFNGKKIRYNSGLPPTPNKSYLTTRNRSMGALQGQNQGSERQSDRQLSQRKQRRPSGFSFRDYDPYSKSKTAYQHLTFKKVKHPDPALAGFEMNRTMEYRTGSWKNMRTPGRSSSPGNTQNRLSNLNVMNKSTASTAKNRDISEVQKAEHEYQKQRTGIINELEHTYQEKMLKAQEPRPSTTQTKV